MTSRASVGMPVEPGALAGYARRIAMARDRSEQRGQAPAELAGLPAINPNIPAPAAPEPIADKEA